MINCKEPGKRFECKGNVLYFDFFTPTGAGNIYMTICKNQVSLELEVQGMENTYKEWIEKYF